MGSGTSDSVHFFHCNPFHSSLIPSLILIWSMTCMILMNERRIGEPKQLFNFSSFFTFPYEAPAPDARKIVLILLELDIDLVVPGSRGKFSTRKFMETNQLGLPLVASFFNIHPAVENSVEDCCFILLLILVTFFLNKKNKWVPY